VTTVCDSNSCRADIPHTVSAKVLTVYLNGIGVTIGPDDLDATDPDAPHRGASGGEESAAASRAPRSDRSCRSGAGPPRRTSGV